MALRSARDSQIFIIGCGISGIGAAQKLLKHGFHNVHIIEATARSGGRIRTGRLGMYVQGLLLLKMNIYHLSEITDGEI